MRGWAIALPLAFVLAVLAGCASSPEPDGGSSVTAGSAATATSSTAAQPPAELRVPFFTFGGVINETGPEYEHRGGYCGVSLRSTEWADSGDGTESEFWYVGPLPDLANMTEPYLVVETVYFRVMHSDGCSTQPQVSWAQGMRAVEVALHGPPHVWNMALAGGNATFAEQDLAEGGSVKVLFHEEADLTPDSSSTRDGHYVYDGKLAMDHHGAIVVHAVEHCSEFPHGCY